MAIAATVYDYLRHENIHYDVVPHPPTESAAESARAAVVPLFDMTKAIMLREGQKRLMAVIPADKNLNIRRVNKMMNAHYQLDTESEIAQLFDDCAQGAVPALGQAYDIPVIWDDELEKEEDIYLEAGDHRELIHLNHHQFLRLMKKWPHGEISHRVTGYPPTSSQVDFEYGL